LLGAGNLKKLIGGLRSIFDLSGLEEATIEVNPDSADAELLETAKELGINRVSIGVQSLSDYELQSAGRIHNSNQAIDAVRRAGSLGFRTSADIIAGLPGQTWETLSRSLDTLVELGVEHISLYCLSLEDGTPLADSPPDDLPSDDMQAELFEKACWLLEERGFIHYEVSNFSLPGCESRHNLNYWRGGEYLGLGPAAASHLEGKRFNNRPDLHAYLDNPTGIKEGIEEHGLPEKAAEEAMLRLRLLEEGLDIDVLVKRFGQRNVEELESRLLGLSRAGSLIKEGSCYRLPPSRVLTSNPVFAGVL
jgi:oxygen-independent coproporphyrinogen-3 oxidase